ncbi:hypothetical protein SRABI70_03875 [Pseudomonas sp. Bi70]|nr:hypothetical protein SRABI70_03875 [Pseudomonas sp. Bi70]
MVGAVFQGVELRVLVREAFHQVADGVAEPSDFAGAADLRDHGDFAAGQTVGSAGDGAQRAGHVTGQQPATDGEQQGQHHAPGEDGEVHGLHRRIGQVQILSSDDHPAQARVVEVALACGQAGEVALAVRPSLHGPFALLGRRVLHHRQVQALADQLARAEQDGTVTTDHEELHLAAVFDGLEDRLAHLVGPGPRQVRGEHADQAAGVVTYRQADIDKLHRLTCRVGQQLGQQYGLMHVADEQALAAFQKHRALGDAGAFENAVAGGQHPALGVGETDPGDGRELALQFVEQPAHFATVARLAQGAEATDHLQHTGAALHVAIQAVDHGVGDFRQIPADLRADALARVAADQGAEQQAEQAHQQHGEQGIVATQAMGAEHGGGEYLARGRAAGSSIEGPLVYRWLGSAPVSRTAAPVPIFARGKARDAKFGGPNEPSSNAASRKNWPGPMGCAGNDLRCRCRTWQGNNHSRRPAPYRRPFPAATRLVLKRKQTLTCCQNSPSRVYSAAFPKFYLRVPPAMEINPILNSIKDLSERTQTIRGYL